MVKPLSFKGDKKAKKRKRPAEDADDDNAGEEGSSGAITAAKSSRTADEPDGWVTMDQLEELTGPVMFTFVGFLL